jgi:hypothetical protein
LLICVSVPLLSAFLHFVHKQTLRWLAKVLGKNKSMIMRLSILALCILATGVVAESGLRRRGKYEF